MADPQPTTVETQEASDLLPGPTGATPDPGAGGPPPTACASGAIIRFNLRTYVIQAIPLYCKQWHCSICAPRLKANFVHRVKAAKPDHHLTCTCAHPEGATPAIAEAAIRAGWPDFVKELRKLDPKLEYCRVLEYQKNGWPHLHIALRAGYLPIKSVEAAWRKKCWPGYCFITYRSNPAATANDLGKYIAKAASINHARRKRVRAYTASAGFFPKEEPRPIPEDQAEWLYALELGSPRLTALAFTILAGYGAITQDIDGTYNIAPYRELTETEKDAARSLFLTFHAIEPNARSPAEHQLGD
jgi:hypothetical protein